MLDLANLEPATRDHMLAEIEHDLSTGDLYISDRLTAEAKRKYPEALKQAAGSHDDDWLAAEIRRIGLRERETYRKGAGVAERKVPVNAAEMLAEGEFNRFYLRGLCLRAIEQGEKHLKIYRAKPVAQPRPESEKKLGMLVDASALLEDLRKHIGVDTALGLPPGPNSGLSAKLP